MYCIIVLKIRNFFFFFWKQNKNAMIKRYYVNHLFRNLQGLVIAGLGDLQRSAEKVSVSQSGALGITGLIWTRYSLAIIPRNWNLFSVNLFVAFTAIYQITRAMRWIYHDTFLKSRYLLNSHLEIFLFREFYISTVFRAPFFLARLFHFHPLISLYIRRNERFRLSL